MTDTSNLEESIKVAVKDGIGIGFEDLQKTIINTYSEGGVQETLKVVTGKVTRKLSSIETNDIDPKLIRRVVMFVVGLVVLYYSVQLFLLLAPIIYPAYKTIQALQVIQTELSNLFLPKLYFQNEDDNARLRWLRYWIIFSYLHFTEHILWFVPLYSLVKTLFLAWCLAPVKYNGADISYQFVIKPFLDNYIFTKDEKW